MRVTGLFGRATTPGHRRGDPSDGRPGGGGRSRRYTRVPAGILSPLLANIALSVLDDHYQHKWDAFAIGTKFPQQRRKRLHQKGGATFRLVRYADDFVVLAHGTQHHAEQARTEVADVLAPMGLTLSPPKTRVVHIDSGLDFLGWHIQRRTKAGTNRKMVYTYPSKK